MNWTNIKPVFKEECILIVANNWNNPEPHWEYTLYTVEKVNTDEGWYLGLFEDGGDEWGDLDDLKADLYCVLPLLEKIK